MPKPCLKKTSKKTSQKSILGPCWAPKTLPKSTQNRKKSLPKSNRKKDSKAPAVAERPQRTPPRKSSPRRPPKVIHLPKYLISTPWSAPRRPNHRSKVPRPGSFLACFAKRCLRAKIFPKSSQDLSKIHPKSSKIAPKSLTKSIENLKRAPIASRTRFFRFFIDFWTPQGLPKSSQNRQKSQNNVKNQS